MTRRLLRSFWLSLGLLLLPLPAVAVEPARLESLSFREEPGVLRVVLELSRPVAAETLALDAPSRAVIDLRSTAVPSKSLLPAANGYVKSIRAGVRPGGTARLVLDLAPGVVFRAQAVKGSERKFELELRGTPVTRKNEPAGATPSVAVASKSVGAEPALKPVNIAHDPGKKSRDVVIAVDAGHGGQDSGAIGRAGTYEKDVVLEIARQLAARINAEPGMRAVMTREGDYFLTLRQRIKRAREAGAMLFVSVHADSVRDPQVSGSSVYVLSEKGATDEQARWLADRENAADLVGGVSLDDKDPVLASVLVDLTQSAQIGYSMQAAERVLTAMREVHEVHRPRVQQAGFVVLKSPDIPSMLVETAFISNNSDERKLKDPARQQDIATAIFKGVRNYFVDHPPEGTRFALERSAERTVVATTKDADGGAQGAL